jgi:hypothetical protein
MITVAAVVEGDGELEALPVLIRRLAYAHEVYDVRVAPAFLLPRPKFLVPQEFELAIEAQARRLRGPGGVLALLDADDDCAVDLMERIRSDYRGKYEFALVVAVREYESLFLAGHLPNPEEIRDAKGAVRALTGTYKATRHQPKLSATVDLESARECRWFRKFERELLGILGR